VKVSLASKSGSEMELTDPRFFEGNPASRAAARDTVWDIEMSREKSNKGTDSTKPNQELITS
jgi:hypothetical protein